MCNAAKSVLTYMKEHNIEKLYGIDLKLADDNLILKTALQKIAKATICHDLNVGIYCTVNATVIVAKKALLETTPTSAFTGEHL